MASAAYSFGIELEFLLLFHESKILPFLKTDETIIKEISLEQGMKLVTKGYEEVVVHSSWAISANNEIATYKEQPLRLAQGLIFRASGFNDVSVFFEDSYAVKHNDYSKWTILGDPSLQGLSRETIAEITASKSRNHDSWGIEIVSPVLNTEEIATFTPKMEQLLTSLAYSQTSGVGATINDHCGFHVHIGKPDNSDFSVKTLQYFALTIAIYEQELLRLCTPNRSNDPDLKITNRENLMSSYEPVERAGRSGNYTFPYVPVRIIREMLCLSQEEGTTALANIVDRIVRTMGNSKGKYVNFSYLKRRNDRPPTIEFRQHEGTTDPVAITYWIEVCHGLVRIAEQFATGQKIFPVVDWDDRIWIEDLFKLMELSERTRSFYKRKMLTQGDDGSCRTLEHLYEQHIPFEDDEEERFD